VALAAGLGENGDDQHGEDGVVSSDRSIADYAAEIWKVPLDAVKRP
jgi:hypothetical protein